MQPSTAPDYSKLYVPAAIVIGALVIGVFAMIGLSSRGGTPAQGSAQQAAAVNIKNVKTDGDPYIGNANAKVVIAYWSDYQCPFCKQFELSTLPDIIKKYVDTGKVKVVFKDYPFLGQDSMTAAEYEHAVWKLYPSKYLAWREAMYNAQDAEGDQGFGDAASIDALTKTIPGLDVAKIKADIAANKAAYDTAIDADRSEGATFGVNGTPGFVTGTTLISGAEPFSSFQAAIDPQL